jgi:hypothetical protein
MTTDSPNQLTLDLPSLVTPDRIVGASIQERFESFHALNPWLLTELEKLAVQMGADRGRKMSIETLVGKIRWDYDLATTGDPFKINDHFTSRYVRLMIERNPSWDSVFATRKLRTAA